MAKYYSGEEAQKRFQNLPSEVKELLYSPEMSFTMQEVGRKNALHLDQIDSLNTETGQVMLGFASPEEFISNLVEMLRVDHTKAEAVAKDVNDMLFVKIRESMKKMYEQQKAPEAKKPEAAIPQNRPAINHAPLPPAKTAPVAPVQEK